MGGMQALEISQTVMLFQKKCQCTIGQFKYQWSLLSDSFVLRCRCDGYFGLGNLERIRQEKNSRLQPQK